MLKFIAFAFLVSVVPAFAADPTPPTPTPPTPKPTIASLQEENTELKAKIAGLQAALNSVATQRDSEFSAAQNAAAAVVYNSAYQAAKTPPAPPLSKK